jgi:hypothetical protein
VSRTALSATVRPIPGINPPGSGQCLMERAGRHSRGFRSVAAARRVRLGAHWEVGATRKRTNHHGALGIGITGPSARLALR